MTWTKLRDELGDELIGLTDAAFRLHVSATIYSNRVGADGRIAKARLVLIPVPARTRRKSVIRELIDAGQWRDIGDGWEIVGYFQDQMSAEEARLTTEYNRVREAIRLCRDDEKRASFKEEERSVLVALRASREHRKAAARTANGTANGTVPLRPDPSRSVPRERGRTRRPGLMPIVAPEERDQCFACRETFTWPTDATGTTIRVDGGIAREFHTRCVPAEDVA